MRIGSNGKIELIKMVESKIAQRIREEIVKLQERDSRRTILGHTSGMIG
jgi:hypothetical protein